MENVSSTISSVISDSRYSVLGAHEPGKLCMNSAVSFESVVRIGNPPQGIPRIVCTTNGVNLNLNPLLSSIALVMVLNCAASHKNMSSMLHSQQISCREPKPSFRTMFF